MSDAPHDYGATLHWQRGDAAFADCRYPRRHEARFDGGAVLPMSSSPQVVRAPFSDAAAVDPEEAFVASLSSCHLLWFLDLACRAGWIVDDYRDEAVGTMARDPQGRLAMTEVVLRPLVRFGGERRPDAGEHERLHHAAHEECFIARSVRTIVRCEPRLAV